MRILGVDRDQAHCQFFVELAELDGHEAIVAGNGARAWELIQADGPFDLIISSYLTGDIDGLDLLKKVRGNAATATTPFIMFTGWPSWGVGGLKAQVETLGGVFELKGQGRRYNNIIADYLPKQPTTA